MLLSTAMLFCAHVVYHLKFGLTGSFDINDDVNGKSEINDDVNDNFNENNDQGAGIWRLCRS